MSTKLKKKKESPKKYKTNVLSEYDFVDTPLLPKQEIALGYLHDDVTHEIVYGGGARGGKSYLGCLWVIDNCQNMDGVVYLIGRSRLKDLMNTTYKTFMRIINNMGLERGKDWHFNGNTHTFTFLENGSQVIFMDLYLYPHDPEYTKLGSLELTGAFLDECGEIPHLAKTIVKSRLSHMLDEYGLIPKLLMTCNPKKNWLFFDYYQPYVKNELPEDVQFIISLVDDNRYISKAYIAVLENLGDETQVRRLRWGDWNYDSEDESLFDYKDILDMFTNSHVSDGLGYITCDSARYGKDNTVIMIWKGLRVVEVFYKDKTSTPEVVELLKMYSQKYRVPRSRVIVDDAGVGGGVTDYFVDCIPFNGNFSPLDGENYPNLRQQCYYRLSHAVKDNEVWVDIETSNPTKKNFIREYIINDLQAVERVNIDNDGKLMIGPKSDVKGKLRRSPDFGDCLSMRMMFHKKKLRFALHRAIVTSMEESMNDNSDD